jgi:hypothetical protein
MIALLSQLEPKLNHPLEYFITPDPEELVQYASREAPF